MSTQRFNNSYIVFESCDFHIHFTSVKINNTLFSFILQLLTSEAILGSAPANSKVSTMSTFPLSTASKRGVLLSYYKYK